MQSFVKSGLSRLYCSERMQRSATVYIRFEADGNRRRMSVCLVAQELRIQEKKCSLRKEKSISHTLTNPSNETNLQRYVSTF